MGTRPPRRTYLDGPCNQEHASYPPTGARLSRFRRSIQVAVVLLVTLTGLTACAGSGGTAGDPFSGASTRSELRLRVRNGNFYDARIYALMDGVRRSLGTVGGNSRGVFTIPLSSPQDIRLEVSILAGPTCVTFPIPVDPGDTVEYEILPGPTDANFCR